LVWGVLVGLTLALYLASLPAYYARLQVICASAATCAMDGALTADGMAAIGRIGISPEGYALYTVALFGVVIVIWATVGFLIFWRRSDEWIGLIASFFLIVFNPGVREGATYVLPLAHPAWDIPVKLVDGIAIGSVVLFFFCFPDGRIVPRWMRWLVVAIIVLEFITIFAPANSPINTDTGNPWLDDAIFLGILVAIALTQIYRYRRVSGPVERQQVKWALFGMACALIGLFCLGLGSV
jgi:hypothetical protein